MANIFGGGSQTENATANTSPWAIQQPYIQNAYQAAQGAFDKGNATGPYSGNYVAGPNGTQTQAENSATNFGNGLGNFLPWMQSMQAVPLANGGQTADYNAQTIANNGIGGPDQGLFNTLRNYGTGATTAPGVSPGLSSALNDAATTGAKSLSNFTGGLQSAANTAMSDPTQRIAQDASTYANNPGVTSSINSTNALIDQTLNEQTVPGLDRQAAAGGSLNSSRAGAADAMAREGAALAKGNADSSILNNAYNTGMGTAAGLYSSGLNTGVNANTSGLFDVGLNTNNEANRELGQGEFNTTTQLGAANSGLGTGLNYAMGDANTKLGANSQVGSLANLGFNAQEAAPGMAGENFNLLSGAGGLQQAGDQAGLNNSLAQYTGNFNFPWQNLNNYFGIVGHPEGTTTQTNGTTTNSGPGLAGGALGLAAGAAGLFGSNGAFPGALSGLSGLFGDGSTASGLSTAGGSSAAWTPFLNGGY